VQLKQRESVGSSFHFLDFHQLQIDTKKQVQQLTEKTTTNELARVKMPESKQHGKLTVMKGQLAEIEKDTQAADRATVGSPYYSAYMRDLTRWLF